MDEPSYDDPVAGAVTAASLAEDAETDTADERRAAREDRAVSRREAKRLKAESRQARRREKAEAKAMAKARRERHTIEARVEREKAQIDRASAEEPSEDVVVDDVVVDEPSLVEESGDAQATQDKPQLDEDAAVALAVAAARPESVSRVVDPIQVASAALDLEDAEAARGESTDAPRRPADAVSASLSERAAAQLAKRRRREEERAAREAERSAQQAPPETETAEQPVVVDDDPTMDRVQRAALTAFDVPEPRAPRAEEDESGSRVLTTVVSVVGIIGYVCAVVLALGAMAVALGLAKGDALFDLFAPLGDTLVRPIRGLFSFSGENGETKELFLAYSVGSVLYLAIGLLAQNLPRGRSQG